MAQRELTERLNQHSQRTGPLLGCGMGLALIVCMVTGMVLYQRLDELRTDVFGIPTVVASVPTVPPATTPRAGTATVAAVAKAPEPTPLPVLPTATPQTQRFRVSRTSTSGDNLNMRSEPNTQATLIVRLPPGTAVEDAGGQANGPAGAQTVVWRRVKAPSGQVGWVPEQYLERAD
jgi:hypothetical protein